MNARFELSDPGRSQAAESASAEAALRTRFVVMLRAWLAAHAGAAADAAFVADAARCLPAADLDVIVACHYRHPHAMLYDR